MQHAFVATLWLLCAAPVLSLRVYSHVYKVPLRQKQATKQQGIVLQALKKLEERWPGSHSKEMLTAGVPPHPSFEQSVLRQKLAKRMHAGEPFVFAGFGSSVSAGHDNIYNQSWLFEMERILKPTFQALNFDIEIRQRAMGGYGEAPFNAGCLSDRAGKGVDALNWEWGMFHDPECEIAHFAKEAASVDGKPVLFSMLSTGVPFGDRSKNPRSDLRRQLFRNHDDAWVHHYHPTEWFFSDDYVSKAEADQYFNKVSPMKELTPPPSVRERVQQWRWPAIAKEHDIQAFYPVIPDASIAHMIDDPWYQAREKAFNVNWHPGPMGHALMASQIAHKMLSELLKELEGASFARVHGPGAGPTADNPLVGTDVKAANLQCGNMKTQMCRSGVEPSSMPFSMWQKLRSPTSKDTWQIEDGFLDNREQIDARKWWRGTVASGEFQFDLEVKGKGEQFAMVCGAPCGWSCRGLNGYVSSKGQRWWNKDMVKGMRTELQGQSDEQILAMAGFNGENSRKEVSDLQFTVNGKTIGNSQLVSMHEELFDQQKGSYCPGCKNAADVCQPVAKLAPGKHKIGMQVKPASYNHQGMHVDVLEVLLVG